ncbi:hypothetical protein KJ567_04110, partial [Candidatus Bipolaricaulota bacterium]|nr:hypothetical protein [Candidatus Bipolaricaulota bacterium]
MRKRKWIRVLLWSVVGLAVVLGGLLIALWVTSPSSPEFAMQEETREIPADWVAPQTEVVGREDVLDDVADEPGADTELIPAGFRPFATRGVLALIGDDEPFGEEMYELSITEEGAILTSSGRFWFKVVLARITVSFEQSLIADSALRPEGYEMAFDGPLGFDRTMSATFDQDRASITRDGESSETPISADRALVTGTFSTYVLVPRLFALRQEDGEATFDLLMFGGPPSQGTDGDSTGGVPTVRISRAGTARIRAGETEITVERYLIVSGLGANELFARGDEFLAFLAVGEEGSMLVYRS